MSQVIAVVGRPNVGKSSLFNYLTGKKMAIVNDQPGVTRDRLYAKFTWLNRELALIDTGGIEPYSEDVILSQMRKQAELAIETADLIMFMVDARSGLQAADQDIAEFLHRSGKPVVIVVNKCDNPGQVPLEVYDFYQLGFEQVFPISAAHGLGVGDLLDAVCADLPENDLNDDSEQAIKVAIIGKPNVGKSSLLNRLCGEERAIVSSVAGTTRDALETMVTHGDQDYLFIDTAGMRRKSKVDDLIERYSIVRAIASIEKADVCLIMVDAVQGAGEQDTKIAGLALEAGKACAFLVNKWDLAKENQLNQNEFSKQLQTKFSFMPWAPIIYISAQTGFHIDSVFATITDLYQAASLRVSTGILNEVIGEAQALMQAPSYKGRHLKIQYATQVAIQPPQFVLFVNDVNLLHFSYERYLENHLRKNFNFQGTPIRFMLRERKRKDQ
ncbi:ribosome biogenesis GTPase Der [Amygdalobacter nucleatus]|uniref:GTPase Der n=1 Tax=Amygdalobacter nucleatus TaxID=3029274 RepID=A0A133Y7S5_9FIRM|nr:ribosome biogenesis GTPase Der [Amygdalobacter nucleatus]KXB39251.1 ribosome biogenesis GTPase Der [Amygdalobacter nucleatus]MDF0485425.1 ribosome biogenesis GTPase Der [Amygdalobacter nucleatus]